MTDTPITPAQRDELAAEYALGVLDGEALARARSLAAADPSFRAEVARWSARLAPLLDDVAPVAPPARAWPGIDAAIGRPQQASNVVTLHRRVTLWRGIAAGATALAASLAVILVTQPVATSAPPVAVAAQVPLAAMLGDDQRDLKLMASYDPASRRLMVAAASDMQADPGHAHELWMIPADGKPRSLGTMPGPRMRAQLPMLMAKEFREGVTLALSVEPMGGSPTGLPTGPVIASGKLERA
ncbi:anti-sigma factor domain-containing protein [Sphingomonas sp.]|uniref:anti-sigma factor n=1 Tax=Sphingomonas sp. TaxID=28214 RepID=UPI00286D409C|nr:anti-sigma factor [Sphingomonas sp.]